MTSHKALLRAREDWAIISLLLPLFHLLSSVQRELLLVLMCSSSDDGSTKLSLLLTLKPCIISCFSACRQAPRGHSSLSPGVRSPRASSPSRCGVCFSSSSATLPKSNAPSVTILQDTEEKRKTKECGAHITRPTRVSLCVVPSPYPT